MVNTPVLTYNQAKLLDKTAIDSGISEYDLMFRAAKTFVESILQDSDYMFYKQFLIFCGVGNNGGDGLVCANLLFQKKFSVKTFIMGNPDKMPPITKQYFKELDPQIETKFIQIDEILKMNKDALIIDAFWGIGLGQALSKDYGKIFDQINRAENKKISIDLPSGLTENLTHLSNPVIQSDLTISFQFPKISFYFKENENYFKNIKIVDIGLNTFYNPIHFNNKGTVNLLSPKFIQSLLPLRPTMANKGDFGKVLLYAGSFGKMGAAALCSRAILAAGAGLLTTHIPSCGYTILQTLVPEAMLTIDKNFSFITELSSKRHCSVVCLGPGLSTTIEKKWLENVLKKYKVPLIIDADGLNLLALYPDLLNYLPPESILTPHEKEFARLVGNFLNSYEALEKQIAFSKKYKVNIIFKGKYSKITDSNGNCFINPTGNVGLAKGGSGDVLCGFIAGFLAQKISPIAASLLGVYLHGLSADIAVKDKTEYCLLASDLIDYLPQSIKEILNN